jgi:hypothetical protein
MFSTSKLPSPFFPLNSVISVSSTVREFSNRNFLY